MTSMHSDWLCSILLYLQNLLSERSHFYSEPLQEQISRSTFPRMFCTSPLLQHVLHGISPLPCKRNFPSRGRSRWWLFSKITRISLTQDHSRGWMVVPLPRAFSPSFQPSNTLRLNPFIDKIPL